MKEKRKLRKIEIENKTIRTLTTYKRFRKRLIKEGVEFYSYNRKNKTYTYFENKEELIKFKEKTKRKKKEEIIIPIKRIRKQVALNCVSRDNMDTGLIYLSIRAITINPDYTENGLKMAVEEQKRILESQLNISLSEYELTYLGIENQEIPKGEDSRLNDMKIHIELFWNGKVMKTYTL